MDYQTSMKIDPVTLAGQQVIVEPIKPDHAEGLWAIGQHRDDWAYLPIPGFFSLSEVDDWIAKAIKAAEQQQQVPLVLINPDSGQPMGSTRLMNIRPEHRGLEIGYTWLGHAYQRTAVNTETKYLLLRHLFETAGAYRVEFKTDERNQRSQRAIERIGAVREGVLRNHMIAQQGFIRNSVFFSITHDEWPQVKIGLEQKLDRRENLD